MTVRLNCSTESDLAFSAGLDALSRGGGPRSASLEVVLISKWIHLTADEENTCYFRSSSISGDCCWYGSAFACYKFNAKFNVKFHIHPAEFDDLYSRWTHMELSHIYMHMDRRLPEHGLYVDYSVQDYAPGIQLRRYCLLQHWHRSKSRDNHSQCTCPIHWLRKLWRRCSRQPRYDFNHQQYQQRPRHWLRLLE